MKPRAMHEETKAVSGNGRSGDKGEDIKMTSVHRWHGGDTTVLGVKLHLSHLFFGVACGSGGRHSVIFLLLNIAFGLYLALPFGCRG